MRPIWNADDPEDGPDEDGHNHECQQCERLVVRNCHCKEPEKMTWCSSNCRAAFDL
jgi:hypothetical protein